MTTGYMQVKELKSAAEVSGKFKAFFADLKRYAARNAGAVPGLTEGKSKEQVHLRHAHARTGDV